MLKISISLRLLVCWKKKVKGFLFQTVASWESFMSEEPCRYQSASILNLGIFTSHNQRLRFYNSHISPSWCKRLSWHRTLRTAVGYEMLQRRLWSSLHSTRGVSPPLLPPALLLILKAFPTNAWNLYYAAYGFYFQVSNDFRNFFDFSSCYLILVIPDWHRRNNPQPLLSFISLLMKLSWWM